MDYKTFDRLADKPSHKTFDGRGPLWFGDPETLLETIADFSVIDDFLSDQGMDDFVEDYATRFPTYRVLATVDTEALFEHDGDYHVDSYDEWFLAVDTAHPKQRVMLWTGEGGFEELAPSFEAFHAALADWAPAG